MFGSEPSTQSGGVLAGIAGIITAIGAIVIAIVTNWDKLRGKIVQAPIIEYSPSEDFEVEVRHFFEVSGTRKSIEATQQLTLQKQKMDLLSNYPQDAEEINKDFGAIEKEAIRFEDVVKELLPVYQKHFTLREIQELNKFYSTDIMRRMVSKVLLAAQDAAPIQVKLINDYYQRLGERLGWDGKSQ